jgi:hypothetical protein
MKLLKQLLLFKTQTNVEIIFVYLLIVSHIIASVRLTYSYSNVVHFLHILRLLLMDNIVLHIDLCFSIFAVKYTFGTWRRVPFYYKRNIRKITSRLFSYSLYLSFKRVFYDVGVSHILFWWLLYIFSCFVIKIIRFHCIW